MATDNSSHIVPSGDDGWWQPRVAVRRMMQTVNNLLNVTQGGKVALRHPLDGMANGLGSDAIPAQVYITRVLVP